jgi:hypothetical protein
MDAFKKKPPSSRQVGGVGDRFTQAHPSAGPSQQLDGGRQSEANKEMQSLSRKKQAMGRLDFPS